MKNLISKAISKVILLTILFLSFFFIKDIHAKHYYSPNSLIVKTSFQCFNTGNCMVENIKLVATVEVCANGSSLNWKYLIKDINSNQIIQYSYNYSPKPSEGVQGNHTLDKLDFTMNAELRITQALPVGNYKVEWTVLDSLGEPSYGDQYFDIVDNQPPSIDLLDYTKVYVDRKLLAKSTDRGYQNGDIYSSDDCTPTSELIFTFSPKLPDFSSNPDKWQSQYNKYGMNFYDPQTGSISTKSMFLDGFADGWLPEEKSSIKYFDKNSWYGQSLAIPVYVWDQFAENNDCDFNNFTVDTVDIIPGFAIESHDVRVWVSSLSDKFLSDINIFYDDFELKRQGTTNKYGFYEFENVGFDTGFSIAGNSKEKYSDGITTLDLLLIKRYILGVYDFDSPYKLLAADANGDKKVSVADLIQLANVILGKTDTFSNVSILCVPKEYKFHEPFQAYKELDEASQMYIEGFDEFNIDVYFYGIKIGDVNFSSGLLNTRVPDRLSFSIDDIDMEAGKTYSIPVYSRDIENFSGMQLALSLKGMDFISLKSGSIEIDPNNYYFDNDILKIISVTESNRKLQNNKPLFYIKAKAIISQKLSSILTINKTSINSEVYTGNNLDIHKIELQYRNANDFELSQNIPNPFIDHTIITFRLPEKSNFSLTFYDINGKKLFEYKGVGNKGNNKFRINIRQISGITNQEGNMIFYKLVSGKNVSIKKMILF